MAVAHRWSAARLVRAASAAHPGLPMSFSGATAHSRRLAWELTQTIALFDAVDDVQQFPCEDDVANGFYDEVSPRIRPFGDPLN